MRTAREVFRVEERHRRVGDNGNVGKVFNQRVNYYAVGFPLLVHVNGLCCLFNSSVNFIVRIAREAEGARRYRLAYLRGGVASYPLIEHLEWVSNLRANNACQSQFVFPGPACIVILLL